MPAILALHAPDIVMFDLPPPLRAKGLEDYERTWDLFFQYHKVSQAFDIEELSIVAGDDVGFALHHALRRRSGPSRISISGDDRFAQDRRRMVRRA
jgi:ketosteroid isomerase-like protein